MSTVQKFNFPSSKRLLVLILITVAALMVPFFGNIFSTEFNWTGFDFIIAGILIFSIGLAIETLRANVSGLLKRSVYILLIIGLGVLIWIEKAVGIFGSPIAGS